MQLTLLKLKAGFDREKWLQLDDNFSLQLLEAALKHVDNFLVDF